MASDRGVRLKGLVESLEQRRLLTVAWVPSELSITPVAVVRSVVAADLDGDGDADLLSASKDDDKIAWYQNTDGLGTFVQRVITTFAVGAESVRAADLDGDGDLDVASVSNGDGKVAWYENLDGKATFGAQQVIVVAEGAASIQLVDMDLDGDLDVLWAANTEIRWHENVDGQATFSERERLFETFPFTLDQLGGALTNNFLSVHAADLEYDGDMDFIVVKNNTSVLNGVGQSTALYEFAPERQEGRIYDVYSVRGSSTADMDGDGDLDVVGGSIWYENTPPIDRLRWLPRQFVDLENDGSFPPAGGAIALADIDGDDTIDVVVGSGQIVAWTSNDGAGDPILTQTISDELDQPVSVAVADLDGDSDLDVIAASQTDEQIGWFANTDGKGTFGGLETITRGGLSFRAPIFVDLDQDGDLDALANGHDFPSALQWHERLADGNFAAARIIAAEEQSRDLLPFDVDHDGRVDILSASETGIHWYRNIGNRTFALQQIDETQFHTIFAGDVDGDGDTDVVAGTSDAVEWYENDGEIGWIRGDSPLWRGETLLLGQVFGGDIDDDGDLDLIIRTNIDLRLIENLEGGDAWEAPKILTEWDTNCDFDCRVHSVLIEDFDGDGWVEVVSASQSRVWFHDNLEGEFAAPELLLVATDNRLGHLVGRDVDNDADVDVLISLSHLDDVGRFDIATWIENRLLGDANDDGAVDFADFLVLAANFGKETDAVWADGDFNLDERIDFRDFLQLAANFATTRGSRQTS